MLTTDQRWTFHSKGFLRLPGIIECSNAAELEDFVWSCLNERHGIRRDDPSTWQVDVPWVGLKDYKEAEVLQSIGSAELCRVIDVLLGPGNWKKPRNWGVPGQVSRSGAVGLADVFIMHPWVVHAASPNCSTVPRFMLAKDIFAASPREDAAFGSAS